jgi:hypothetical protein
MSSRSDWGAGPGNDLILGAVDHYTFYEIAPFLLSLRQTDYRGHICLFAGPAVSKSTRTRIERLGAEVISIREDFPFVADPHPDNARRLEAPIHICNYRYFLYYDYLLKRGSRFRNVLITDVRDVAFQKNPFDFDIGDAIHVAMESPDLPIGACSWTGPWVVIAYGDDMLERIRDRPMSCSGTTLAPVPLMEQYLRALLDEISTMNSVGAYLDQAAHNVLLHERRLEPVRRLNNFEGPILTVGSERSYLLNENKQLVNRDGSTIAVVHQYDRHPELLAIFEEKIRPSGWHRLAAKAWFRLRKRIQSLPNLCKRAHARAKRAG